ncbi:hypothetical protein [Siccirubricoccus phaeus]|uniref:hypothetical protein n=1 Tax=Siccirubricoccus phaeus TaxID=2595053 RepID=UPI0011F25C25|nr:hypothetical protein [Siccirubricoccus phaeus]
MDMGEDGEFGHGFGGPGAEDFANAAAALAAALVREAGALAGVAASLRQVAAVQVGDHSGGPLADVRRQRAVLATVGDAALTASLLVEAAAIIGPGGTPTEQAMRIATAARRAGALPASLVPPLRAAALALGTDDGAARIAAASIAEALAAALAVA